MTGGLGNVLADPRILVAGDQIIEAVDSGASVYSGSAFTYY